jgi:chemotaxis response regulator CheB
MALSRHFAAAQRHIGNWSKSGHAQLSHAYASLASDSVTRFFGPRAIAIILSGMLDDGAHGIAAVRIVGGVTMAQNELTSMHFDMPRAAIDLGGSEITFSPAKIDEALCALAA